VSVDDIHTLSPKRRELLVSRAWKRLLLAEDGGVSKDGKVVLQDLMVKASFFGKQYELGNPERTFELAVRRQTVIHILACLAIGEEQIMKTLEIYNND
jgi:L-rhamnose isomerase